MSTAPMALPAAAPRKVIECRGVDLTFRVPEQQLSFKELLLWRSPRFRTIHALRNVSFSVNSGEIIGLVGRNGAGKSTLMRVLAGIYQPTAGEVQAQGRIGSLMELGAGFHPDLSGRENIRLNGSLLGMDRRQIEDRTDAIIEWSGLENFIDLQLRYYSSGMRARLGFAIAVEMQPDILLVDEILAVGDADFRRRCEEKFEWFVQNNTTIVLVSHTLSYVQRLCHRTLWLEHGEVRGVGPTAEIVREYKASYAQAPFAAPQPPAAAEAPAAAPQMLPLANVSDRPALDDRPQIQARMKRWGRGDVLIEDVVLRNEAGDPRYSFNIQDTLRIDIHYAAQQPVLRPLFGVQIHQLNGQPVTGTNTMIQRFTIESSGKAGVICLLIADLPLASGIYLLSATVFQVLGGKKIDLDYWQNVAQFEIIGGPRWNFGPCRLKQVEFHHVPHAAS